MKIKTRTRTKSLTLVWL